MNQNKVKSLVILDTKEVLNNQTNLNNEFLLRNRFQVRTKSFLILGYAGYIQGVKSEVVFGQTYGMTSLASKANAFHKGRDEPANLKYNTIMKAEYINHSTRQHETVAEIVGVQRGSPRFNKVGLNYMKFLVNIFVTANSTRISARILWC